MNRVLAFFSIAVFSIFVGSQVTEGALLLPHWKTLSAPEFYAYYAKFGHGIGGFYTVLTVVAALISAIIAGYCAYKKSPALKYALLSVLLSAAFVAFFYIYFKGANQQFFDASLNPEQLKAELISWGNWHWIRVGIEMLALVFLVLTLNVLTAKSQD